MYLDSHEYVPPECRWLSVLLTANSRFFFRANGYWVRVIGRQATAKEAPIMIGSSHSTFLDAFVVHWTGLPSIVVRSQNMQTPVFGSK